MGEREDGVRAEAAPGEQIDELEARGIRCARPAARTGGDLAEPGAGGERSRLVDELCLVLLGDPLPAELVYLRNTKPTTREQPALGDAADPAWAETLVGGIAEGMRSARFVATPSPDICRSCPVRSSCPAFAGAPVAGADDA